MSPMSTPPYPNLALNGFESIAFPDSPANRRQRISMACQYCRHRKIRCCGGAPCRNCTRSSRECDYTPVPDEVNRATREKKALARQSKAHHSNAAPALDMGYLASYGMHSVNSSPISAYTPYMHHTPTFDMSYVTPVRPSGHRRSLSTPAGPSAPWTQPPPAPMLHSPAMLESSGWMYNACTSPQLLAPAPPMHITPTPTPTRVFPSVLEQTPMHQQHLAQLATPQSLAVPQVPHFPIPTTPTPLKGLGISTPSFEQYITPASSHASVSPPLTPSLQFTPSYRAPGVASYYSYASPTLAPPIEIEPKVDAPLMGLGIAMPQEDVFYSPVPQSYFPATYQ